MEKRKLFYSIGKIVCTPIFKITHRYRMANKNTIPDEGGYIIACNHLSYSDPVLLGIGQKRQLNFMAKSTLFKNKFFSLIIRSLGAFPVEKNAGDGAINHGIELIKNGGVMTIFIEGTRSRSGELLRPRSGVAIVAYQTKAPVIPAAITVKGGLANKMFRRRTVRFGEPLTNEQLGLCSGTPREFRNASRMIMDKIREMREMDI